jgi:hypothetical protein
MKGQAQNWLHVQETLTRGMNHIKLRHGQQEYMLGLVWRLKGIRYFTNTRNNKLRMRP